MFNHEQAIRSEKFVKGKTNAFRFLSSWKLTRGIVQTRVCNRGSSWGLCPMRVGCTLLGLFMERVPVVRFFPYRIKMHRPLSLSDEPDNNKETIGFRTYLRLNLLSGWYTIYHKTCNISCTLVGIKIVDDSDVVGASPVGAAPTTSSFST